MIIGTTLMAAGGQTETYYTPWMNAAGSKASMTLDVLNIFGMEITATVQTKTEEEPDSAANDAGREWSMSSARTSVGSTSWDAGTTLSDGSTAGLLQLIRFKLVLTNTDLNNHTGFVNSRIQNPSWQTH